MDLVADFAERFGVDPVVEAWAPGRVNIIGDHIDYAGLPVLPMAIDRGTTVLAVHADGTTAVSTRFEDAAAPLDADVVPSGWTRYVWGVLRALDRPDAGAQLLVDSDLPGAAGLSSSSSLVLGVVAALDRLWSLDLDRRSMIDVASRAERAVGIEGGTMDQTVIALAQPGAATRIEFTPSRVEHIELPEGVAVVAAHCGVESPKTGVAGHAYDRLVLGMRCAAALLAGHGVPLLGGIPLDLDAASELPIEATPRQVASRVRVDPSDLVTMTARRLDPDDPVPIRGPAVHAVSEAARVDAATSALRLGDVERLGSLLDGSHASLASIGVSIDALDETATALREAGARGARPTGAGFGGFCVGVCEADLVDEVIDRVRRSGRDPVFRAVSAGSLRA